MVPVQGSEFDKSSPANNLHALALAGANSNETVATLEIAITSSAGILYDEPPSAQEAIEAIQFGAAGYAELDMIGDGAPHFEIGALKRH